MSWLLKPMSDDRDAFAAHAKQQCLALGEDHALFERAVDTVVELDRYDYSYLWSWLGLPIIQMPADVLATQEVIWTAKPDVIVETGVARGGSVVFLASMLQLLGRGTVIGVDIDLRAHNRESIQNHPLAHRIKLVEGGSTNRETLERVRELIPAGSKVMVILDSNHSREHVLGELRAYGPMVTPGQYLVVADTLLGRIRPDQTPKKRSAIWEPGNEPLSALKQYIDETGRFEVDPVINGKLVISSSPGGYLRCRQS
jgi:cephalosporin hydroxylase